MITNMWADELVDVPSRWAHVVYRGTFKGNIRHLTFQIRAARLAVARDMDEYLGDKALTSYRRLYFSIKLKRKKKRWQRASY